LTESGQVFTFGQNIYGALGDGTQTDNYTPNNITSNFSLLSEEKIINIYSQGHHVIVLSSNGRLFGFGRNFEGELGDGGGIDQLLPIDLTAYLGLQENETIVHVEAGWTYTVILTSYGRVISSGGNWQGIIGDGTIDNSLFFKDVTGFFNLNQGEIIVQVSSKEFFSLALTSQSRLFIYGNSSDYLNGSDSYIPVDVTDNLGLSESEYIVEIYTGSQHGFLVTNLGRIIGFGLNSHGELGFSNLNYYGTPVDIELDFVSNDKTYEYYAYGETLSLIIPEKEGYLFKGWYIDPELTIAFDLEVMPGENVTLYPKWELDTYQVTYVVDAEYTETELWPLEYQNGSSYPVLDIHLELGLFLGWYLTPDFSGEVITDLEGYSGDIILYGKVIYTDLVNINQLLAFDAIPEKQIAGFTAKIKGLVYEVSATEHYYILTDETGFLLVYSDIVMEAGKEYEVTGSFELYNDDPYSYEPPFWPMITDVSSVTPLGNENGFTAPSLITIDFASLELVLIDDYSLYGQPVTITGKLDYQSFSSQYVLIDNSLLSSVTIYISMGVEDQALSDYLLNNIGEVINLTGFILNIDYLDGVVSSVYIVVDSMPS
jgi:uncharacterized repeat protein (TIGR02543 family)